MKLTGLLLLLAGWGIILTALPLLRSALPRDLFVLAGTGVEVLGFILAIRAHSVRSFPSVTYSFYRTRTGGASMPRGDGGVTMR